MATNNQKAESVEKAEVKKAETVKKAEPKPKVAKPKYVKVKSKVNGRRFIGGTWYSLEKDKETEVTVDAKRVLTEAGAIYL